MAGFIFEEAMMEDIIFISNAARGDHPGCRQGQSLDRQIEGSMRNRVVLRFMLRFLVTFFDVLGCTRQCSVQCKAVVVVCM